MSTLTTNGQVGAATPQNLAEMAFTAVLMVLTVTIFTYVLGEITNVIMAQDAALVATRAQARALLPQRLCARILCSSAGMACSPPCAGRHARTGACRFFACVAESGSSPATLRRGVATRACTDSGLCAGAWCDLLAHCFAGRLLCRAASWPSPTTCSSKLYFQAASGFTSYRWMSGLSTRCLHHVITCDTPECRGAAVQQ